MALYHADVGFPRVALWTGPVTLKYSAHARAEAADKYADLSLPEYLDVTNLTPFEIEVEAGKVTKACYRARYSDALDLTLVIAVGGFVKTVWANRRNDTHRTLDRSKYTVPCTLHLR